MNNVDDISTMLFTTIVEIDMSDLFEDDSDDWAWCVAHATFQHQDPAVCEFMIYLYPHLDSSWKDFYEKMVDGGCSDPFVIRLTKARQMGATRALLHVG